MTPVYRSCCYIVSLAIVTSFIFSCSSDNDSSEQTDESSQVPVNAAPHISNVALSAQELLNGESLEVTATVTDDNGVSSVTCDVEGEIITLTASQGDTYIGTFTASSFGQYDAICSASDTEGLSINSAILTFDVLPNVHDVIESILGSCNGEFVGETIAEARCTDGDNVTFAYKTEELSQTDIDFNQRPVGQNFQHILSVIVSVDGVSVMPAGDVFASESLTEAQLNTLSATGDLYYVINVTINNNLERGITTIETMGDFTLVGKTVAVQCEDIALTGNEVNRFTVLDTDVAEIMNRFSDYEPTSLACEQITTGSNGADVSSPLYGALQIIATTTEATAPVVTIDDISFSETLSDGTGRDVGNICANIIATDAGEIASQTVALRTPQGDIEMLLGSDDAYCLSLQGLGGQSVQIIAQATDNLDLTGEILSAQFLIDENEAPTDIGGFADIECESEDIIENNVISAVSTDPEGDAVSYTIVRDGVNRGSIDTFECQNTEFYIEAEDVHGAVGVSQSYIVNRKVTQPANTPPVLTVEDTTIGGVEGQTIDPISLSGAICTDAESSVTLTPNSFTLPATPDPFSVATGNLTLTCTDIENASATQSINYVSCPAGTNYNSFNNGCS